MRCAHCRNEVPYRAWYQFRLDGGYRCRSCRKVYYIEDRVVQSQALAHLFLMFIMYVIGLFVLIENELLTRMVLAAYLLGLVPISVSVFAVVLEDAPSVRRIPEYQIRRRRWVHFGMIIFLLTNVLTLLIQPQELDPQAVHFIRISGGFLFVACLVRAHLVKREQRLSA